MEQNVLIAIIAIVAIAIVIGVWLTMRRRHTDHLRDRFGDEYDRTLDDAGDRTKAEAALVEREKRVDALDIRPLNAAEHTRFATEWRDVKAVFVDSPVEAVLHADRLLATMMKTIGYPMADFDRRFEDLTVNHADVARHYREGHLIVSRHGDGSASTEDMRQAMKHYEALFDHIVADAEGDGLTDHAAATAPAAPAAPVAAWASSDPGYISTGTTGGAAPRATDIDGDGDADIVRTDRDGDGTRDHITIQRG